MSPPSYTIKLSAHDVRLIRLALDQWTKCEDLLARLPNPDDEETPIVTDRVAHQMLADAYDTWRAASLTVVQLSLRALAEQVRDKFPTAKTLVFDWSDQGDFLNLSEIRDAERRELDEDSEFDACGYDWNLGTDCASQWSEYMTDENGEPFDPDKRLRGYHLDVDKALVIPLPTGGDHD